MFLRSLPNRSSAAACCPSSKHALRPCGEALGECASFPQLKLKCSRNFIFRNSNTARRSLEYEPCLHHARRRKTPAANLRPAEGALYARSRRLSLGLEREALSRFPQRNRRQRLGPCASCDPKSSEAAGGEADSHLQPVLSRISGRVGEAPHQNFWTRPRLFLQQRHRSLGRRVK